MRPLHVFCADCDDSVPNSRTGPLSSASSSSDAAAASVDNGRCDFGGILRRSGADRGFDLVERALHGVHLRLNVVTGRLLNGSEVLGDGIDRRFESIGALGDDVHIGQRVDRGPQFVSVGARISARIGCSRRLLGCVGCRRAEAIRRPTYPHRRWPSMRSSHRRNRTPRGTSPRRRRLRCGGSSSTNSRSASCGTPCLDPCNAATLWRAYRTGCIQCRRPSVPAHHMVCVILRHESVLESRELRDDGRARDVDHGNRPGRVAFGSTSSSSIGRKQQ